jgi:hypothetical protein
MARPTLTDCSIGVYFNIIVLKLPNKDTKENSEIAK